MGDSRRLKYLEKDEGMLSCISACVSLLLSSWELQTEHLLSSEFYRAGLVLSA